MSCHHSSGSNTTPDEILQEIDHRIKDLEQRFPFDAAELEILCRCHDQILVSSTGANQVPLLLQLAKASPYQYFLLPGDEMQHRVEWMTQEILPAEFEGALRQVLLGVNNDKENTLEQFIQGIAKTTGRYGTAQSLTFLYQLVMTEEDEEEAPHSTPLQPSRALFDLAIRLAVATQVLVEPNLDDEATLVKLHDAQWLVDALTESFVQDNPADERLTRLAFLSWAEAHVPLLAAPLTSFVQQLLFHGHNTSSLTCKNRVTWHYETPYCDTDTRIVTNPVLLALSLTAPTMSGKVCVTQNTHTQSEFCTSRHVILYEH